MPFFMFCPNERSIERSLERFLHTAPAKLATHWTGGPRPTPIAVFHVAPYETQQWSKTDGNRTTQRAHSP
jgi:hypothetical protein